MFKGNEYYGLKKKQGRVRRVDWGCWECRASGNIKQSWSG